MSHIFTAYESIAFVGDHLFAFSPDDFEFDDFFKSKLKEKDKEIERLKAMQHIGFHNLPSKNIELEEENRRLREKIKKIERSSKKVENGENDSNGTHSTTDY